MTRPAAETPATGRQVALEPFLATIREHAWFFDPAAAIVVSRAPGRLDLMGGIADYSGSLVLQLPLAVAAYVAAQLQSEPAITVRSLQAHEVAGMPEVSIPLSMLAHGGHVLEYDAARALLTAEPASSWAAYVAGGIVALGRERGITMDRGIRILLDSRVPPGKGTSSSAAIEVAAMHAVAGLLDVPLEGRDLALLCQLVENRVVGAPCGVMDQMTAACGEQDRLLALLCQPAELLPAVPLPPGLAVWGIDSGIRHAVGGADYTSVRVGAFMGYRIVAEIAGLKTTGDGAAAGGVAIHDPRWHGYLANVGSELWLETFRDRVPEIIAGAGFLARYGGTTDAVTRVDPDREYRVRQPTEHPILEHDRVSRFRTLLEDANEATRPDLEATGLALGRLMLESHASYGACGLGSEGTDRLVELVRTVGADQGLFGAKITGGGSGGTVAVLGRSGAATAVREIAARYRRETGRGGALLEGSSHGATPFGTLRLEP